MKLKICLWGFAFACLFVLGSCKTKESSYKTVKEKAVQKPPFENSAPVVTVPTSSDVRVQKEKVTTIEGSGLKRFSVVIGSFINKTNASSLKERMQDQGYQAILVQNQQDMYRVIISSFDDRSSAISARDVLKYEYKPDFQDAWILEQEY